MKKSIVNQIRATARIESDKKLDTLARFTLAVILQKAKLTEAQLKAFFDAGYTQENAIDVILGVSLATLCNYVNNIAETPINPELQAICIIKPNIKKSGQNDRSFFIPSQIVNLI